MYLVVGGGSSEEGIHIQVVAILPSCVSAVDVLAVTVAPAAGRGSINLGSPVVPSWWNFLPSGYWRLVRLVLCWMARGVELLVSMGLSGVVSPMLRLWASLLAALK